MAQIVQWSWVREERERWRSRAREIESSKGERERESLGGRGSVSIKERRERNGGKWLSEFSLASGMEDGTTSGEREERGERKREKLEAFWHYSTRQF